MDTMMRSIMAMTVAILVFSIMAQMVQGMVPSKDYCCPIPGCDECFYTYDELYQHFVNAHPSEPISIIWE